MEIVPTGAGPAYGHDGWIFGYQTQIVYFPGYKVAAALQINSDPNGNFKVTPGECLGKIVSIVIQDLKAKRQGDGEAR